MREPVYSEKNHFRLRRTALEKKGCVQRRAYSRLYCLEHARYLESMARLRKMQRVAQCLPENWGDGWDNVMFNVTCENQVRADERIPILKELPFKHKGIMCAPLIGAVSIEKYLGDGVIEQVICGGENYDGARPCHFEWVQALRSECVRHSVTFCFIETGSVFIKDGKRYYVPKKTIQSELAYKSGMNFVGKPIEWKVTDHSGAAIPKEALYVPQELRSLRKPADLQRLFPLWKM